MRVMYGTIDWMTSAGTRGRRDTAHGCDCGSGMSEWLPNDHVLVHESSQLKDGDWSVVAAFLFDKLSGRRLRESRASCQYQ